MPTRTSPRTLATAFDPRRNALNAIRLVLASAVILAHAWPLGGWAAEPSAGGLTIGDWAVCAFFAISGFLITRSRMRTPFPDFVLRRFLRIYPAYLTVTVVIAFGFAPIAVFALGEPSWDITASTSFVLRNLFLKVMQDDIPGTLDHVPFPGVWNGSFWTLACEFACYLLIGVLVALLRRRSLLIGVVAIGMVLVGIGAFALGAGVIAVPTALGVALRPTAFFLGGALVFLVAHRLPASVWFAGTMVLIIGLGSLSGLTVLVAPVPLAVLCVLAGVWLRGDPLTARHDVSYGLYLYGFPVGQIVAHALVAPAAEPWVIAGVTVLASVPFAVLSWLVIERPAMRLSLIRRSRARTIRSDRGPARPARADRPSCDRPPPSLEGAGVSARSAHGPECGPGHATEASRAAIRADEGVPQQRARHRGPDVR